MRNIHDNIFCGIYGADYQRWEEALTQSFEHSMDGKRLPKLNKYKEDRNFGHLVITLIIESPHSLPMKRNLPSENQKIHQPFQHVFKAKLILIAKTSAPGQYIDSGFAQYRLE